MAVVIQAQWGNNGPASGLVLGLTNLQQNLQNIASPTAIFGVPGGIGIGNANSQQGFQTTGSNIGNLGINGINNPQQGFPAAGGNIGSVFIGPILGPNSLISTPTLRTIPYYYIRYN